MKMRMVVLVIAALGWAVPVHAELEQFKTAKLQDAAVATGNGTAIEVGAYTSLVVQATFAGTATVTFEGTIDDTTWVSLTCNDITTFVPATTTSTNSLSHCSIAGLSKVRARISSWSSGAVTVIGRATTAPFNAAHYGVSLSTLLACEDLANGVCKVEQRFSYSGNKTSDTQVKSTAGFVHNVVCIGTDAAATAGTIILYDSASESGTVVMSWAVQAAAYAQPVVFPLDVIMTTGIYLGFTTTADVTCTVSYR